MPRVPSTNQVRLQGLPTVRTNAAVAGAPIAQAVAGLAGQVAQIAQEEQEKVTQTQVNDADVQLRRVRDRLLYDANDGALTAQRLNAKDAPDTFRQRWSVESAQILAGLPADVQERVRQRAQQVEVEAEGIVLRHVDDELDKADVETRQAIRDDALNMIVANPANAAMVDAKMTEAVRVTEEGFHLLDAPPQRLNSRDTPVPYHPKLWAAHRPTPESICEALRKLLSF
jgi:hypothetical protein